MENLLLVPREAEHLNVPLKDARMLIAQLEATAEGCRALLEEWQGLWSFLGRQQQDGTPPCLPDESLVEFNRMTRLLGYEQTEAQLLAIMDDEIKSLADIQNLINEDVARSIQGQQGPVPGRDPKLVARLNAAIWPLVDQRYHRLTLLLSEREREAATRTDTDALAAFDDSIDGDRLHRYQNQWGRVLGRTLGELQRAEVDRGWRDARNKPNERASGLRHGNFDSSRGGEAAGGEAEFVGTKPRRGARGRSGRASRRTESHVQGQSAAASGPAGRRHARGAAVRRSATSRRDEDMKPRKTPGTQRRTQPRKGRRLRLM